MPKGQKRVQGPEYGPSEGLERNGLFEDAAQSYIAVARAFPKEATPALRAADNFMKIGDTEQAAEWFDKGLANITNAKQATPVAFRLFEIYSRMLHDDDSARAVLETFLERFPNAEQKASVEKRLNRLNRRDGSDSPPPPASLQFEHD
jgi:tetratricopeptide (TPR) repeat protein